MDDTAFHYSRALRIIMVLAIVLPILGIGLLLWYFSSVNVPEPPPVDREAIGTMTPKNSGAVEFAIFPQEQGYNHELTRSW